MIARGICEQGTVRRENQDAILICTENNSGLFIVADGVGGSADGGAASRYLTESYTAWWRDCFLANQKQDFQELFESIKTRAEQINQQICSQYGAGKCCSTLVLLFVHKQIYGILSVGDSRIYYADGHTARLLTRDDVWENQPSAQMNQAYMGKIVSAVGGYEYLEYSSATDRVAGRQSFLLCSDGIYKFAEKQLIQKLLLQISNKQLGKTKLVEAAVSRLEESAVNNQTNDNYSALIVRI